MLNVRDAPYSAVGDGLTDDTAAIQRALDDAKQGDGCHPVVIPSTPNPVGYLFSQLRLNKGQIVLGQNGMFGTRLKRIPGSTGSAIREKTLAEGGDGSQGVSIRGLSVNCSGCVGDGIDLGRQQGGMAGTNWGFNGILEDVYVSNAGGAGFRLVADAITGRNLSAYFNGDGIVLSGYGNNTWHGVSTSENRNSEITTSAVGDSWFGVHMEPLCQSALQVSGSGNRFWGITAFLMGDVVDLIKMTGTTSSVAFHGVMASTNYHLTKMVTHTLTPAVDVPATISAGRYQMAFWEDVSTGSGYFASVTEGTLTKVGSASGLMTTALGQQIRTVTASFTVAPSDGTILTNGSGITLTLPAGNQSRGRMVTVRNVHPTAAATVTSASGLVDGATTQTLAAGKAVTYQSEGNVWFSVR